MIKGSHLRRGSTRTAALGLTLLAALALVPLERAEAANWLLIQGSEPEHKARPYRIWGFVQGEFHHTDDSPIPVGGWAGEAMAANRIGPDKRSAARAQIKRARLGVRGRIPGGVPLDYALALEAGDNAATYRSNPVQLIDASLSYRFTPALRLRLGQFKHPGSEEGMRPAPRQPYINPSAVVDQLVNESFVDTAGENPLDPNRRQGARSLYHDIGVQLFGVLPDQQPDWEHSYALMLGNGHGIARPDDNSHKDVYLYWASEHLLGGKGAARLGTKVFAWWQQGKRTLDGAEAGTYARTRTGAGFIHTQERWRLSGEYVAARGMIPNGTDGGAVAGTWNLSGTQLAGFNLLPEGKANGWYLEGGWQFAPRTWLDLRFDRFDRGTDQATTYRRFDTWTLGLRHQIDRHWQLMANLQWREGEAPDLAASAPPNQLLDALDPRLSLQIQAVF